MAKLANTFVYILFSFSRHRHNELSYMTSSSATVRIDV